jgi:NADPH-dependent glutamate synthase beta subunit-like oxidoreductase
MLIHSPVSIGGTWKGRFGKMSLKDKAGEFAARAMIKHGVKVLLEEVEKRKEKISSIDETAYLDLFNTGIKINLRQGAKHGLAMLEKALKKYAEITEKARKKDAKRP